MCEKYVYNVCFVDSYEDIYRVEGTFVTEKEAEDFLEECLDDWEEDRKEEMRKYYQIEKRTAQAVYVVTNTGLMEGVYSSEERAKEACGNNPNKQITKWYIDFAHEETTNDNH